MKKYPWRHLDSITPLIDGEAFFPAMLAECQKAQKSIHLSLYWFESGQTASQFIQILSNACARGIQVSCLLDVIGSKNLSTADCQKLTTAGVLFGWYNPVKMDRLHLILQRDHTKLLIIDKATLFIGGTGIADTFAPSDPSILNQTAPVHWRENMFRIQGPILIDALQSLARKWYSKECDIIHRPQWCQTTSPFSPPTYHATSTPQADKIRWLESKGYAQRQILKAVINRIKKARHSIVFATAYFAPDRRLRQALQKAATRGVKVTILLPGIHSDYPLLHFAGQFYYEKLLKADVRIFEYQQRFLHMKIVICDDFVCLGSSNLDTYTQRWSLEANIEVLDHAFAQRMRDMIQEDIQHSSNITLQSWQGRSWWHKVKNLLAYKIKGIGDMLSRQISLYGQLRQK